MKPIRLFGVNVCIIFMVLGFIGRCRKQSLWKKQKCYSTNGVLSGGFDIYTILTPSLAEQRPDIKETFQKAHEYVDIFKSLNPELGQIGIDPDNWEQVRGFVHGVVSGFNVHDVNAWVTQTLDYQLKDKLRERMMDFEGECEMQWIPSPATIQKISKQLDARHGAIEPPALIHENNLG